MSANSLDKLTPERRTHLKSPDRGMPLKRMAKLLTKRLHKAKEHETQQELVDQTWFHGRLTSEYAVKILATQGEFLVRENPLRPGDYFLSVNDSGSVKHFPVQRSTTKNMKYKYKLYKSGSFESLVELIEYLHLNKILLTDSGQIHLLTPANRDTGHLIAPEFGPDIQTTSAPATPAGTPPLLKRNCSDPSLAADQLRHPFNGFTPRPRAESRSSPPSLYVEDFDTKENDVVYDSIDLPSKQNDTQSALMKKKQSILNDVFKMFRDKLYKVFIKHDCLTLAKHLTRRDLEVVWGEELTEKTENDATYPGGLELILLPEGNELRKEILKRHSLVSIWTGAMVIAAGETEERVDILKMFIGIAHVLFSSLGNLNGFMSIMEGLEALQVKRLKKTWRRLEDCHPNLSIVYHNTLKSVFALLNSQGVHPAPGKVKPCLPFITHVIRCLEVGPNPLEQAENGVTELDELEVMYNHLSSAREYGTAAASYKRQAQGFIRNMQDDWELEGYFTDKIDVSTEVGLGFHENDVVWKMDGLLTLMSQHVEPN